jgi:hypothetical protein
MSLWLEQSDKVDIEGNEIRKEWCGQEFGRVLKLLGEPFQWDSRKVI